MPTTAGSFVLAKEKPSINSALADKLTEAGMIIIAKANLTVSVLLLHCNV
jgi:Asp-tRNA(Asn)/Glu-tRNA(Gln) amidotransferase A subunit family amidase